MKLRLKRRWETTAVRAYIRDGITAADDVVSSESRGKPIYGRVAYNIIITIYVFHISE